MAKVISRGGQLENRKTKISTAPKDEAVVVLVPTYEKQYTHLLHNILPNVPIKAVSSYRIPPLDTIVSKFKRIVTTRKDILVALTGDKTASVFTYAGSVFDYKGSKILIIDSLRSLPYSPEYNLLSRQYGKKLLKPELFPHVKFQPFLYHKGGMQPNTADFLKLADKALIIGLDIETKPFVATQENKVIQHNVITDIGYSFLMPDNTVQSHTMRIDTKNAWDVMKAVNAHPVPKIMHGGKYDSIWCMRWGVPVRNYVADTMHEMHSWYHDLRKSLAHVGAFTSPDYVYWKEGRKATDLEDKLIYNARDVHYTMVGYLYFMMHAPSWTKVATRKKIRRTHYNVVTCLQGMKTDSVLLSTATAKYQEELDALLEELRIITGSPDFNPNAPVQNKMFLQILASNRLKVQKSDKAWMTKVKELDNFTYYCVDLLEKYKAKAKIMNSYLKAELWDGRIMTSLDVCGTSSDRFASRKADFWHKPKMGARTLLKPKDYGWAAMTIKAVAREHVVADDGMLLFSADLPSSEAYFVDALSGDPTLHEVLYSGKDYHCTNASMFFGVPYEDIYDALEPDPAKRVKNKPLRTLAKRVNHGSNYNMGPAVMLETMGLQNILQAQELLGLDWRMKPIQIAAHLLALFKETYPYIKGGKNVMFADSWYGKLCAEVNTHGRITCPDGWSKYIMGDPLKSKPVMNNLASIKPQRLSAEYLHQGWEKLWQEHYEHKVFEPLIPIHDEVLGQCSEDKADYYSKIIVDSMTLDFNMGDTILRIVPDAPVFGRTWEEVH